MRIVIFGATGTTGHEVVKQALAQGHEVTAFVRNPRKLLINSPQLKIVSGELNDKQLIDQVVEGHDAVLSTLGASNMFKYDLAVVKGIQNIINAMQLGRVNRFIYLSFAGVSASRHRAGFMIKHIAPRLLSSEVVRHEDSERLITRSLLDWTIVRAPTLTNANPIGTFRQGENISSGGIMVSISRSDVADFMIQQLTDQSFIRKAPLVLK